MEKNKGITLIPLVITIDTEAPNTFTPEIENTTNSIKVKANTTDKAKTAKSGTSGNLGNYGSTGYKEVTYYYSSKEWWMPDVTGHDSTLIPLRAINSPFIADTVGNSLKSAAI